MPRPKTNVARIRKHAADAFAYAHGNMRKAVARFAELEKDISAQLRRPAEFIKRWAERDSYRNAPRSGRPPKVSDADAKQLSAILKQPHKFGSTFRHFQSVDEAIRLSAAFRAVLSRTKPMHRRALLRRLKQVDRTLTKRQETIKFRLSDKHKQERRVAAAYLRDVELSYLIRIFWIDAKKIYITGPGARKVYCSKDSDALVVEDPRIGRSKPWVLHYYAMASSLEGGNQLVFVTGTTQLKRKKTYTVSDTSFRLRNCHEYLRTQPVPAAVFLASCTAHAICVCQLCSLS